MHPHPCTHRFASHPSLTLKRSSLAVKLRIEPEISLCKKQIPYYAKAKHILFLLIICCTRAA